jgi:hypothetical protein
MTRKNFKCALTLAAIFISHCTAYFFIYRGNVVAHMPLFQSDDTNLFVPAYVAFMLYLAALGAVYGLRERILSTFSISMGLTALSTLAGLWAGFGALGS